MECKAPRGLRTPYPKAHEVACRRKGKMTQAVREMDKDGEAEHLVQVKRVFLGKKRTFMRECKRSKGSSTP